MSTAGDLGRRVTERRLELELSHFRTELDSDPLSDLPNGEISFEVDHLDEALIEGWSVLLSGDGRATVEPSEYEFVESLGIAPWADGRAGHPRGSRSHPGDRSPDQTENRS